MLSDPTYNSRSRSDTGVNVCWYRHRQWLTPVPPAASLVVSDYSSIV